MTIKQKVGIIAVALVVSFAAGRFSAPEKIKIETKLVETESKSKEEAKDTKKNDRRKISRKIIKRPDGTVETTVTLEKDDSVENQSDQKNSSQESIDSETKKEITKSSQLTTLAVIGGVNIFNPSTPSYGLMVYRPILGPVGIGVWGLSNATLGVSIGVSF